MKDHEKLTELTLFGRTKNVNNKIGALAAVFVMPLTLFVGGVTLIFLFLSSLEKGGK